MSKTWFQDHDVSNKLRQALEALTVNQLLASVFDGLQNGKATINVIYNGETVSFVNNTPILNTVKSEEIIVPITESEDTMQYEQENNSVSVTSPLPLETVEVKPKRRRTKA